MTQTTRPEKTLRWFALFLFLAALLTGLQVWNAISMKHAVETVITANDPATIPTDLQREKTRQEIIGKQIENQTKGAVSVSLTAGLSAAIAALAAIMGAILTLREYLDAGKKERQDRNETQKKELAAREKERLDRLGKDLNDTVSKLVADDWRLRVVGSAGLLAFFTEDRKDFHLQAFSALIAAARINDDETAVRQGVRLAFERAVRTVSADVLSNVSWQGAYLREANLTGACLKDVDLRDTDLQNALLDKADLTGATLVNARLQGCRFDDATLVNADLTYADLAGASLRRAVLSGANLSNTKVLNLDLDKADLRKIGPGWRTVPWDATRNWRNACFDTDVAGELDQKYGSSLPDMRVLMLMWELPPMVAGGTWTACYHLVRNLRRRGANVTVVVPWAREALTMRPLPFGIDVPIKALGIELQPQDDSQSEWSAYGAGANRSWSPYGGAGGGAPSPYGGFGAWHGSPYGTNAAQWSPYGYASRASGHGGPYAGGPYGPYGASSLSGSTLFRLMGEFTRRLCDFASENSYDVIHAHDWVTFDAARAASAQKHVPWVAHFHSTEVERQPDVPDILTQRIEQGAVDSATRIVAVSNVTRDLIRQHYDPAGQKTVNVIPNCLSNSMAPPSDMGRFESHRVVFLGRLSRQKGVDRFGEVAKQVRDTGFQADFVVYGEGPERLSLQSGNVSFAGPLPWNRRGEAFRGASAAIVPSRAEPFGMVILEAMQHRVPVIYAEDAGAAEVLTGGKKVVASDIKAISEAVIELVGDLGQWEKSVVEAAREIEGYAERRYEEWLMGVWKDAITTTGTAPGQTPD